MPPADIYPGDGKWPYLNTPYLSILEKNPVIRVYSSHFPQTLHMRCGVFYPEQQNPLFWLFVGTALRAFLANTSSG
jgi:hypothetical protein